MLRGQESRPLVSNDSNEIRERESNSIIVNSDEELNGNRIHPDIRAASEEQNYPQNYSSLRNIAYQIEDDYSVDDSADGALHVSGHHIDDSHQRTTNMETLIHLIKGNIGTGILAMPDALKNSGLYTGIGLLPIIATICIHCMHTLVRCSTELNHRVGLSNLDYPDVAEQAFKSSNIAFLQNLSNVARRVVNVFLIITQMGFCCVYVVFISANLKQVLDCKFPGYSIDIHGYMSFVLLFLLAISMIRSLKVLAPFSLLSNFFLLLGLVISFYYILQDLPTSYDRKEFSSWQQLPLFLGTAIYAFEGIGIVLPLERNMKEPEAFRGYNGVLNTAMVLVTCGYIAVGFFGYLKFGDAVHGSITLNLPPGENLAQLVKILMAVAIYLTYPLMLYVPAKIMWPHLKHKFTTRNSKRFGEYGFRALLVVITFILAAAIPNIGLFISLVGAISSSTLAIIFPPIIEMVTFWSTMSRFSVAKCICIIIFGLFCFATGSYASINSIIDYFSHHHEPLPALIC